MTDHLIDFFAEDVTRKAAVPGLGVFYAEKNANGRYRILFEEVAPKGKDFINHVAFRMNVTEAEAVAALDEWVKDILKSLKSVKVATLPGIGTFEVNEGRVQFLPSAEQEIADRFGLEKKSTPEAAPSRLSASSRPVSEAEDEVEAESDTDEDEDEEETPQDSQARKKRRNTILWICVGVVMVGLIGVMLYFLKPLDFLASDESDKIDEIILGNPVENGMMPEEEPAPVVEKPQAPAPSMNVDDEIEAAIEAEEREKKATKAAKEPVAKPVEKLAATKPASAPTPKVEKSAAKPAEKPAPKIEPVAKPAPAPKPAANPAPKPAAPKASAPKSVAAPLEKGVSRPVLGRFYIVVGSFSNLDNARTRYNELAATSAFDMRILFDAEKNIYKVSVKEFNDKNTAIQFKKGLLDNGFDGWIYEHK